MNPEDKQVIVKRYQDRLSKYIDDERKILATGTKERQQIRYSVLAGIGDLNGYNVLDIGCGLAGFYDYLGKTGVKVNYTGIDITPEFIERNKHKYPEANFLIMDIEEVKLTQRYDYIVCSQVFNNKYKDEDNLEAVKRVLSLSYDCMNKGLAIDFLSNYVDYKINELYYFPPETVFSYAKSLTKRVMLRHDYPLYEFCLYLYKDFEGWNSVIEK